MDNIFLHDKLVAIHVRQFPGDPMLSVNDPKGALQLLTMNRGKGEVITAHRHIPRTRTTETLQECLIVIKGSVRYDFFDKSGVCFQKVVVGEGEAMFILGVALAVEFLEDSCVYELKNGPFLEDKELV
ncbi:MAG: hypothetical protein COV91_00930 [Candidatus Taylorbacteria bacterium CG11_big_fil_rev_8_21_14_0_20_46_11]|uniref:Uncharacterized protein n=1 Tax=Candidatus Taylorbacteria bacterium CG11_big_fil_rev_8_21_14_0_20_46_11 TaxID=1975025 RepID=A0A2H0KCP4_9BACT|nr:MAG: hypothetical protein COV91_00930 [Candidatus Taylorbacteria bacterium CG11_big_fil_rev_8_21_14_0_20_46_11]